MRIAGWSRAVLLLLLAGCEEKTKPLEIPLDSPDEFCAAFIEQAIRYHVRCVGGPEAYHRRNIEMRFQPNVCEELRAAVEAEHLRFDEAGVRECFQLLETGACTKWWDTSDSPCAHMLVGTRLEGESCDGDWVLCAPGSFCDECTRVCRPLLRDGERCLGDWQCETDACTTNDICERPGAIGQPCTARQWCERGAICEDQVCRPPKQENEMCERYVVGGGCGGHLACISVDDGFEGVCLAPVGVGAPCVEEQCISPSFCDQGVCALLPLLGEPCREYCLDGICFDGICSEPREIGERCEPYQCRDGWCDGGVCAPAIQPGGACISWEQCGRDAYCFDICMPFDTSICE